MSPQAGHRLVNGVVMIKVHRAGGTIVEAGADGNFVNAQCLRGPFSGHIPVEAPVVLHLCNFGGWGWVVLTLNMNKIGRATSRPLPTPGLRLADIRWVGSSQRSGKRGADEALARELVSLPVYALQPQADR